MRTTFKITPEGDLVSAIAPKGAPHAVKIADRIVFTHDYQTEYGPISAGARGFVDEVQEGDGTLWLLMEGLEPALCMHRNILVASPFTCEDLIACIKLPIDNTRQNVDTVPLPEPINASTDF